MANQYTDAAKDRMLDSTAGTPAWPPAFASLHTGDPGTTGANEATGGSPAYARKSITWNAASGGSKGASNQPVFDVPAGTYLYAGLFSASTGGTFFGYSPLGAGARRQFTVDDTTADTLESPAHGLSNDFRVVLYAAVGAALPTPLAEGTTYWVVNATTDDFQVSTTQGGASVAITAVGDGEFQRIIPETFAAQGTYTLTSTTLSLPG